MIRTRPRCAPSASCAEFFLRVGRAHVLPRNGTGRTGFRCSSFHSPRGGAGSHGHGDGHGHGSPRDVYAGAVRFLAPYACAFAAMLVAQSARAGDTAPTGTGATAVQTNPLAERLFQDGRTLLEAGDAEGACAKFEASLNLDPRAVGTLLNIAMCKEATGKLATAWGLYREVATRSRGSRPDRVEVAEKKERELAPRLSSLVLEVPKTHAPGLVVRVDGLVLEDAAWSSALPADLGEHVVEASAPGYTPATIRARVTAEKQRVPVAIPQLVPAPREAPPAKKPPTEQPSHATRNIGIVLTGAGVVALGVGGVLGVDVLARADRPKDACPAPCVASSPQAEESRQRYDDLDRQALVTNILLPVGAVMTVAGAYLWFFAGSSSSKTGSSARVVVGPGSAGVTGTF